jgi:hypothetical protein
MDKPKAHHFKHVPERTRKGLFSPIEFAFTTRLSLDECVARFERENAHWLQGEVQIEVFPQDNDRYAFTASSKGIWGAPITAVGRLRRWEGTATLITGEVGSGYNPFLLFYMGAIIALIEGILQVNPQGFFAAVWLAIVGTSVKNKSSDHMIDVIEYIVAPIQDPGKYPKRKRD